ncbi:mechanosensitive ion channel family protein [Methylomonas methanica]|uniref:Small-conductance mechanosensitive channel n=1 Tax=Methylomonas methanica (strain DSM 25384 / MC09) TaxID=857087 RepID=G0A6H3_METMM|nr:mechanosensitive ion channel domain-containing protein [Methylomonas methanica]AEF99274.1 MscS Mechanosensitive ion channel [Methylomonas methanica MC09]
MNEQNMSQIWDAMLMFEAWRALFLLLGMAVLVFTAGLFKRLADRASDYFPSRRLLFLQIVTTLNFCVYIFGGSLLIYVALSPAKEILLALGGGAAVAIGLSLKDLVASLVAGLTLLFDRPFLVGDRVQFADTYGEIKSIGLRSVKLVTLDDNLVTIPNARFISDVVSSGNAGSLDMMVVMPFHIALDADLETARRLLYETVVTSRFVYLAKPVKIVVAEVVLGHNLALKLIAKAYVLDVKYEKDFQTDVVSRVSKVFLAHHIKRPLLINHEMAQAAVGAGHGDS